MTSRAAAHTPIAKALHWTIVLLVTIQFVTALAMPDIGPHTQPDSWVSLHFSFGVLILAVMTARLIHRLMYPVPLEASQAPPKGAALRRTSCRSEPPGAVAFDRQCLRSQP
jgi:cytochrome b561